SSALFGTKATASCYRPLPASMQAKSLLHPGELCRSGFSHEHSGLKSLLQVNGFCRSGFSHEHSGLKSLLQVNGFCRSGFSHEQNLISLQTETLPLCLLNLFYTTVVLPAPADAQACRCRSIARNSIHR